MKKIMFLFGVLFTSNVYGDSIFVCSFQQWATFDYKKNKIELKSSKDNQPLKVVFAGIDTKNPVLKGNAGESPLRVIRRKKNEVYLSEEPPGGGVNLITIFFKEKVAIFTKQYSIGFADDERPFLTATMGTCE